MLRSYASYASMSSSLLIACQRGKRVFTPLRPFYNVENAFARLGMWRLRLSRCYEQTALGAQTWLEVACVAYLCGRLRVEPT